MVREEGVFLTRRNFLRGAAYGTLGLALGGPLLEGAWGQAPPGPKARVVVVRHGHALTADFRADATAVARMLDAALLGLSGEENIEAAWRKYISPEDIVGIKTSVMMTPTHPEVVNAIVVRLRQIGVPEGNIFIGDRAQTPGPQCTALLNVPGLKAHALSGVAAAIKNYITYATNLPSFHANDCAALGSVWHLPAVKGKTRLCIIDALRPLFQGPQVDPKYLWPYQGIIMGTDPVAVDTVCAQIIQAKRDAYRGEPWPIQPPLKHIVEADRKYHLGTCDPRRIEVVKIGWRKDFLI